MAITLLGKLSTSLKQAPGTFLPSKKAKATRRISVPLSLSMSLSPAAVEIAELTDFQSKMYNPVASSSASIFPVEGHGRFGAEHPGSYAPERERQTYLRHTVGHYDNQWLVVPLSEAQRQCGISERSPTPTPSEWLFSTASPSPPQSFPTSAPPSLIVDSPSSAPHVKIITTKPSSPTNSDCSSFILPLPILCDEPTSYDSSAIPPVSPPSAMPHHLTRSLPLRTNSLSSLAEGVESTTFEEAEDAQADLEQGVKPKSIRPRLVTPVSRGSLLAILAYHDLGEEEMLNLQEDLRSLPEPPSIGPSSLFFDSQASLCAERQLRSCVGQVYQGVLFDWTEPEAGLMA